jgi:hypothetical protein
MADWMIWDESYERTTQRVPSVDLRDSTWP